MTPLERTLRRRIAATGPISVAEYMAECLIHPRHGYYTTRDPLGAAGDFTTAPEISQMFGELLGLALAQCWQDQGRPGRFTLAELGPGRGTLMADLLRATLRVPGFHAALDLWLVEVSPALRDKQRTALMDYSTHWVDSVHDLPQAPLFAIANEFFDALPIRQFQRDGESWRERQVGFDRRADRLVLGLSDATAPTCLAHRLADTRDGDVVETRPGAGPIAAALGARISEHGGVAIVVDYGDWRSLGDTLQALRSHSPCDPLTAPGAADLTAHVDFESVARNAAPALATRLTPQGVFLERIGISARTRALAAGLTGPTREQHLAAHRRLTHPAEMGSLFKVLGLYPRTALSPPGLEP